MQAYITVTMANYCRHISLSQWQTVANIHYCHYGKLLKTYTTVNMANCWKQTIVMMANCWQHTPQKIWQIAASLCHYGKLLHTHMLPWQIAGNIYPYNYGKVLQTHITMTNCCYYMSLSQGQNDENTHCGHYGKLLQVYINMYLWQIAADIHHFHKLLYIIQYTYIIVYIANCWKHISLHHCGSLPTPPVLQLQCHNGSVCSSLYLFTLPVLHCYIHCQNYTAAYNASILHVVKLLHTLGSSRQAPTKLMT